MYNTNTCPCLRGMLRHIGSTVNPAQPLTWANYPVSVALWAHSDGRSVRHMYSSKFTGADSISSWATRHHDVTPQSVKDELAFDEVMGRLAASVVTYGVLVCHSAGYDIDKALGPLCVACMVGGTRRLDMPMGLRMQRCLGLEAFGWRVAIIW